MTRTRSSNEEPKCELLHSCRGASTFHHLYSEGWSRTNRDPCSQNSTSKDESPISRSEYSSESPFTDSSFTFAYSGSRILDFHLRQSVIPSRTNPNLTLWSLSLKLKVAEPSNKPVKDVFLNTYEAWAPSLKDPVISSIHVQKKIKNGHLKKTPLQEGDD